MLVQNKGNHPYTANGLTLNPGTNNVNEKDFGEFLEHPLMASLDKKGEFEYQKGDKKLTADELIDLIDDTFDLDLLEEMKDGEKRTTVLKAIDLRIKELKGE